MVIFLSCGLNQRAFLGEHAIVLICAGVAGVIQPYGNARLMMKCALRGMKNGKPVATQVFCCQNRL